MVPPRRLKRRRAGVILLGVLVLGVAVVAWEIFRPRNDPKFVGSIPANLQLVPRSRYAAEPRISIPWFGGRRFEYPSRVAIPKNWKDNPLASGFLQWKGLTPPSSKPLYDPGDAFAVLVSYMDWRTTAGEEITLTDFGHSAFSQRFFEVPYVFGNKELRLRVAMPKKNYLPPPLQLAPFELEVPPLGVATPRLNTVKQKENGIELTLTPKQWLGPTFATEYEVTALGLKPGEVMLLSVSGWPEIPPTSRPTQIQLGRAAWFRIEAGKKSLVQILSPKVSIRGDVVIEKPMKVRVYAVSTGGARGSAVTYKDSLGNILATGNSTTSSGRPMTFSHWLPNSKGPIAMQIDGEWIGQNYDLDSWLYRLVPSPDVAEPHAPGDYRAIGYYSVKRINFIIDGLRLPQDELEAYVRRAR